MKKFTFKTIKPTGKYRSFDTPDHRIKLQGKEVGSIEDKIWTIRLAVKKQDLNEDRNPNCEWRWVTLSRKSDSLEDAKTWLNVNYGTIVQKYNLYHLE